MTFYGTLLRRVFFTEDDIFNWHFLRHICVAAELRHRWPLENYVSIADHYVCICIPWLHLYTKTTHFESVQCRKPLCEYIDHANEAKKLAKYADRKVKQGHNWQVSVKDRTDGDWLSVSVFLCVLCVENQKHV